jgi:hypothetical protein
MSEPSKPGRISPIPKDKRPVDPPTDSSAFEDGTHAPDVADAHSDIVVGPAGYGKPGK